LIFVRSLIFTAYFYLLSVACVLEAVPAALFAPRRALIARMAFWNRATLAGLSAICGVRVEIRGREHLPTGAALIAGKHQCMLDAFTPFSYLPDPTLVMKKELMWIPFMGWYSKLSGMIVIDRGGHATTLRKMMVDARDQLDDGRQLVIFPEGHRQDPGAAPDYKPGIAALYRDLDMPCIPVATNSGAHWPAHGFLRKPGVVVYEYLEPIPAGLKRAAFMALLEERIETASNALLAAGI
jgi:1-acyl-sn-glycerol-3-phosphate acyltransferase